MTQPRSNNFTSCLRYFVALVFLLLSSVSMAQEPSSVLQQQIAKISELEVSSPFKALKLAEQLHQQAPNNKDLVIWLTRLYSQFSDVDRALDFANQATHYKLSATEQMHVQMAFAMYYHFHLDNANTFKHIDLAVKAAMLSESATNLVRALSFRSSINSAHNRVPQAMEDISSIYESIDFVTDPHVLSTFYNALCAVYLLTNQFDGAIEAQLKSIEYMEPSQNQQQLSVLHYNLADIYWQTEDFDAALQSYSRSLNYSINSGDKTGEGYAYMGQGKSQLMLNNFQQALSPLKKAEAFFSASQDTINIVETNSHLAQVYLNLKDFDAAKQALEIIKQYPDYLAQTTNPVVLQTQETLAQLLYAEHEYQQAYLELQHYVSALKAKHKQDLATSEQQAFEKLSNTITAKENEVLKLENELSSKALSDEKMRSRFMQLIVIFCTLITVFVTLLLRKNQKLRKDLNLLATTDELTQLYNRRKIMAELSKRFINFKTTNAPLYVAIFDLDLFKNINDSHGHNMGDDVLKAVAACAKENIGAGNYVGRYGGEEFLIVLTSGDYQSNYARLEQLRIAVSELTIRHLSFPISISIGMSEATKQDEYQTDIIHRADKALYEAKKAGRNLLKGA